MPPFARGVTSAREAGREIHENSQRRSRWPRCPLLRLADASDSTRAKPVKNRRVELPPALLQNIVLSLRRRRNPI